MFRGVVKIQFLQDTERFSGFKGSREGGGRMDIQIIQDDADGLGFGEAKSTALRWAVTWVVRQAL